MSHSNTLQLLENLLLAIIFGISAQPEIRSFIFRFRFDKCSILHLFFKLSFASTLYFILFYLLLFAVGILQPTKLFNESFWLCLLLRWSCGLWLLCVTGCSSMCLWLLRFLYIMMCQQVEKFATVAGIRCQFPLKLQVDSRPRQLACAPKVNDLILILEIIQIRFEYTGWFHIKMCHPSWDFRFEISLISCLKDKHEWHFEISFSR